jgi:hypothetical protein
MTFGRGHDMFAQRSGTVNAGASKKEAKTAAVFIRLS